MRWAIAGGVVAYAFILLFALSLCRAAAYGNEFDWEGDDGDNYL